MIDARTFNFRDNLQSCRTLVTRKIFWCKPQFLILLLWNIKLYIITGDRSESEKMKCTYKTYRGPMIMPKIFKRCSSRCIFCCSLRCIFCYSPRCIFWQFQGGGGCCSRPLPIPSSSAPNYIHMDKRVHGQTEERSARWPRQTFQAGIWKVIWAIFKGCNPLFVQIKTSHERMHPWW